MIALPVLLASLAATPCQQVLDRARATTTNDELLGVLQSVNGVELAGLRRADAALEAARTTLAGSHGGRTEALETLEALCAELDAPERPAATVDTAALGEILSRPQLGRRFGQEWALRRLAARLWDFIKDFLQGRGFVAFSDASRFVFLAAVGLAALWLARRVLQRRRGEVMARAAVTGQTARVDDPDEMLAQARDARRTGDLRAALGWQMRATLAALSRTTGGYVEPGATNREVLARLEADSRREGSSALFARLVGRFDAAIYGSAAIDDSALDAFADEAARFRATLTEVQP